MKTENSKTKNKRGSALKAASLARSAVGHVNAHSNSGLANTGTNISYEGATAPGSGGAVGTGYASGKEAAGESIRTVAGQNRAASTKGIDKAKEADESLDDEDLDEDFEPDEDVDEEDEDNDEELG